MKGPRETAIGPAGAWEREAERIFCAYPRWKLGKKMPGPGWLARRTFWDGATISIEASDLIILEARLKDQREQERQARAAV